MFFLPPVPTVHCFRFVNVPEVHHRIAVASLPSREITPVHAPKISLDLFEPDGGECTI